MWNKLNMYHWNQWSYTDLKQFGIWHSIGNARLSWKDTYLKKHTFHLGIYNDPKRAEILPKMWFAQTPTNSALYLCTAFTWKDVLQVVLKMTEANLTIYHNWKCLRKMSWRLNFLLRKGMSLLSLTCGCKRHMIKTY